MQSSLWEIAREGPLAELRKVVGATVYDDKRHRYDAQALGLLLDAAYVPHDVPLLGRTAQEAYVLFRPFVRTQGEFEDAKAMRVLYGSFDEKENTSSWKPTPQEEERLKKLEGFSAPHFQARPWKTTSYNVGEEEKVLFLTETQSEPGSHPATALVGGAIFTRNRTGWEVEKRQRVITEIGSFGAAPDSTVTLHEVDGKKFLAGLTTGYTGMGVTMSSLVFLSDVPKATKKEVIAVVGKIQDTGESNDGACPSEGDGEGEGDGEEERAKLPECYSYESSWELADPGRAGSELPDLVLSVSGTRLNSRRNEVQPDSEERRYTFRSGQYRKR